MVVFTLKVIIILLYYIINIFVVKEGCKILVKLVKNHLELKYWSYLKVYL